MPRAVKGLNGKRVYDKLHYCLFCGKGQQRIARHLQEQHSGEDEIKALQSLKAKDKSLKLDELRGKGDFHHNMKVLRVGGQLVVWRRPAPEMRVLSTDYLPCQHCLIFVTKAELWRHRKRCPLKKGSDNGDIVKRAQILIYSNQYGEGATEELKSLVLQNMNHDIITSVVRRDKLILTYGSFMLASSGIRKSNVISQRM